MRTFSLLRYPLGPDGGGELVAARRVTSAAVEGLAIRTQRPGDRARVRELVAAAFGDPVVADLVEALQDAPAGAAGLSYVAG
jgi:hypothetical protein